MKRTVHARFVGIGRYRPAIVDKRRTYGREYTDRSLIERELAGEPIPPTSTIWTCGACRVSVVDRRQHARTKMHARNTQASE